MAATQTNIRSFFKPAKTSRAPHKNKLAKNVLRQSEALNNVTADLATTDPNAGPATTDPNADPAITEGFTALPAPAVSLTTPVKRKCEQQETCRKRRREVLEEDDEDGEGEDSGTPKRTPSTPASRGTPKSACKRLIMTPSTTDKTGVATGAGLSPRKHMQAEAGMGPGRHAQSPRKPTQLEQLIAGRQLREHLSQSSRLAELQKQLQKVNQCSQKVQQVCRSTSSPRGSSSPQLKKFAALEVDVPVSPVKTPTKANLKSPTKVPAHQRLQHLTQRPTEDLTLPSSYRWLREVFRAVDTVVSLLHNRQELITYSRLKPAVQELLRRSFSQQHLGQIKTVFPLAYFFKQEPTKGCSTLAVKEDNKEAYQLTVTANLDYKSPAAQNLSAKFDADPHSTTKYRKMDSVVLVERRNIFHNSLIHILQEKHNEFLQTLDPPISSGGLHIRRWHPAFPLEEVGEVAPAPLPPPPTTLTLSTARDVLDKAQGMFAVNPGMQQALEKAAAKEQSQTPPEQPPPPTTVPASVCTALKGVSASLLHKIRAREAAKTAREMTRSSQENQELAMMARLPEIAGIVRNIFVTERKAALPWETVASKVTASHSSISGQGEVDRHLEMLVKLVPDWCVIHKLRAGTFLKLDRTRQLSSVTQQLHHHLKQHT